VTEQHPYGKCRVCGWHARRSELIKGAPGNEHCPKCNSDDTTWTEDPPRGETTEAHEAWLTAIRTQAKPVTHERRRDEAMRQYRELTQGIRMIREALEQTFGTGVLPAGEYAGVTPLEECEAIARAIYHAAALGKK
jgi:hypothetical protein